ncbi:unnamed protein product [Paramecium primaurelia]|uniref:Protein kinase domain-containing protein n=1 Tax=Paramecium primaurelia TaxID=5886 RepID=A0A8S1QL74_PARPR|nr:unnamed protein product [Paramecium primaurelia]
MHSLKIAHRDIKPSNIMYIDKKQWVIGDFGCALKYEKSFGVFQIEGTTQYLPYKYRVQLLGKNFNKSKMDLFENDIYAFTLTMLKIYKQDSTLYQLQNMLDDQNTYKQLPYEFQILNKNQSELQAYLQRSFTKIPLQKQFFDERFNQIKIILRQISTKKENIIPILFNLFHFNFRTQTLAYQNFIKNEAKKYDDLKMYIELMDPYFTVQSNIQILQITSKTTFEQYEIISEYWFRLGNINQQLKLCQQYQQFSQEHQFKLKLQELSILMFQEEYQQADQLIINLIDDEQNMDDVTFIQLQIIKSIRGRIWLEVADQFEYWVNESQTFVDYKENWLFLSLGNLSWLYKSSIIKHYFTPKDDQIQYFVKQEDQVFSFSSTLYPRWIELCNWKGIDHLNSFKEMIKQLEQRGADIYGIKIFIQQLIKRIDMSDDKQKIIDFYETAILYYEIHFQKSNYFWELYFHYSQYCYSIKEFEKSLEFAFIALKLVDIDDLYQYIQIELIIIAILTQLNNFDQSKERISKIWQFIMKINSNKTRSILLQKLHSIFTLFFRNNQIVNIELIYKELSNYLEQEQDNSIIIQCQRYRSDLAFFIQNRQQINQIYQSWIPFCLDTQNFDPQLFTLFYKYVYTQKQLMKSDSEQQQYLLDLGKFNQNFIIYDEILGLKGQEVLHIQNSQWQYLQGAEQLNQEQLFKQMAIQQQQYFKYNCYQDINITQNLNNVIINYR